MATLMENYLLADDIQEMIMNYIGEKVLGLPRSY